METLYLILLIIAAVILIIGIIRVMFSPYNGLGDLILDLFLLDWMGDALGAVFGAIGDLLSDHDW